MLRAKLNPHFLFNSLQNISVLTGQDPETASRMLTRLGELLRAVLRRDSSPESTLREELELTQSYVALEQLRFGDRLRVVFDIAPDVQAAQVPCFILQPLIENAVVHGLRGVKKNGLITVAAAREDRDLVLRVAGQRRGPALGEARVDEDGRRPRLDARAARSACTRTDTRASSGSWSRAAPRSESPLPLRFDDDEGRPDADE